MTLPRTLRRFVLLELLFVASSGVLAYLSPAPPALATTPTGQQLTAVPVRWCVMKGTAPDINPGSLGRGRHGYCPLAPPRAPERPGLDSTGGRLTLRSSVTWQV